MITVTMPDGSSVRAQRVHHDGKRRIWIEVQPSATDNVDRGCVSGQVYIDAEHTDQVAAALRELASQMRADDI